MERNGFSIGKYRNTFVLSKLHTDVRANELLDPSKCLTTCQYYYETFLNKNQERNTDTTFEKVVALESTLTLLKLKTYEHPESLAEARMIQQLLNK